jgi:hypothetical protein
MHLISCFNERTKPVRSKGLLLCLNASPKVAIEQEDQILKFQGGYVQVSRCTKGEHWAHIVTHDGECTDESIFESVNRRITTVKVNGNPLLLDRLPNLLKVSLKIAPALPRHGAAEVAVQKSGWAISFPGAWTVLEENAGGFSFRVRVYSSVTETRLDRAYPATVIGEFPAAHLEELEVLVSPPLLARSPVSTGKTSQPAFA